MQTAPQAPNLGSVEPPSIVSYRGVILVIHSLLTLYSRSRYLSNGCPSGKKSDDPTVPASVLLRDDREGTTSVPACLAPDRGPRELPNHESRAPPGAHTRQGKESVHLVGNRRDLVGRQGRHRCTGGPDCCR